MAFKILDSEELSLLSENQRIQYEKELDLYQQRTAFVERIEMLENVHIEPYKPNLEPVTVINEIQIRTIEKKDQIVPVLPAVSKPVDIWDKEIEAIEWSHSALPLVISPSIKTLIPFEQLKNNLHYTPSNMPEIVMPDMNINVIAVPEKKQPSLPNVSSCVTEIKAFIKPEKRDTKLPIVIKPVINVDYEKEIDPVSPTLPAVSVVFGLNKTFQRPELQNIDLPTVGKVNTDVRTFKEIEHIIPDLPKLSSVDIKLKKFSKPERSEIDLPIVSDLEKGIRPFVKPEKLKVDLPVVSKASIQLGKYERFEKIEPNIVVPTMPNIVVKTFKVDKRKVSNLPLIDNVKIPEI